MQDSWEECDVMTQAKIIAFDQVASYDDAGGKEAERLANKPSPPPSKRRGKSRRR